APRIGLDIPGSRGRLITTLSADDTSIYLSEENDFEALEAILQSWCHVSCSEAIYGIG
ncbi:hypothetical protein DFP72DRAFT_749344, partial [Ephemerocybe angulata]